MKSIALGKVGDSVVGRSDGKPTYSYEKVTCPHPDDKRDNGHEADNLEDSLPCVASKGAKNVEDGMQPMELHEQYEHVQMNLNGSIKPCQRCCSHRYLFYLFTVLLMFVALGLVARPYFQKQSKERDAASLDIENDIASRNIEDIINGKMDLVRLVASKKRSRFLSSGEYQGISAEFCRLNWTLHEEHTERYAFMDEVIKKSCVDRVHIDDFSAIAKRIQERVRHQQETLDIAPRPTANAVLFQESRCGSTLVANIWSQLPNSRVFVEPGAPATALLMCQHIEGPCHQEAHNKLVQDVFHVMASTVPGSYKTIWYKLSSVSTRGIEHFGHAFPNISWYFLHRDPVEVMMSYFKSNGHSRNMACLRSHDWDAQPELLLEVVKEQSNGTISNPKNLALEDYCAAHLASLELSVWREYNRTGKGTIIDYSTLPSQIWEHMLVEDMRMQISTDTLEKMHDISGYYSKGYGKTKDYVSDVAKKHKEASTAVTEAAASYMAHYYNSLEMIRHSLR